MDKVRVILTFISIATIIGPIAAEVIIYRDNLSEMVLPPELINLVNGKTANQTIFNQTAIKAPQLVNSTYDPISRTAKFSFNFTNPLNFKLSIKSMNANVLCTQDDFLLGQTDLSSPIEMQAGQTILIPVTVAWNQEAINHFTTAHPGAETINVDLNGVKVDVAGINFDLPNRIHVGAVPLK